jgi:hypothetical protein
MTAQAHNYPKQLLILNNGGSLQTFIQSFDSWDLNWPLQETSGVIAIANNVATNLGRNLIVNGGFDADTNWVKGTGWSIGSGVASCDGSQVAASNLSQDTLVSMNGKTFEVTFTVSNYSAGTVTPVLTNTVGTARSANGTYTEEIIGVSGFDGVLFIQADVDFIGSVDIVSVKQTDILASSAYANPGDNPLDGDIVGGVTVGTSGGGAINRMFTFDGATSYVKPGITELTSKFNSLAGTISFFVRPAASDGSLRHPQCYPACHPHMGIQRPKH